MERCYQELCLLKFKFPYLENPLLEKDTILLLKLLFPRDDMLSVIFRKIETRLFPIMPKVVFKLRERLYLVVKIRKSCIEEEVFKISNKVQVKNMRFGVKYTAY